MTETLHALLLWPFQALIELLLGLSYDLSASHPGVAVVILSLLVNLLILPVYLVADRWKAEERTLREGLRPRLLELRAVFRGDERHMVERCYYRQQGYHPLMALRSSLGLLMQVPFFLAAYIVLSHSSLLDSHAWPIENLLHPDRLLRISGGAINVLPFVMTAFNLASAWVYGRRLPWRENLQFVAMAAVFLILLYDSPAGLVLYWTVNNMFSLAKNVVSEIKRPTRVFHALVIFGVVGWGVWWWRWGDSATPLWLVPFAAVLLVVVVAPRLWRGVGGWLAQGGAAQRAEERLWFVGSALGLALLAGVALPAFFVASSPFDLAGGGYPTVGTVAQAISLFVLVPLGLWALAPFSVRRVMTWGSAWVLLCSLISAFVVPPTMAFNPSFTAVNAQQVSAGSMPWWSLGIALLSVLVVALVSRFKKEGWAVLGTGLVAASLVLTVVVTGLTMHPPVAKDPVAPATASQDVKPVFSLSRKADNQVLLFVDGFPAPELPAVLAEEPSVAAELEGFTWYANTASYTNHTLQTTPAMLGGPDYIPEAVNQRQGEPLEQKHSEGNRASAVVFANAGERVVVSDPEYITFRGDRQPFEGVPNLAAVRLAGVFKDRYFRENQVDLGQDGVTGFDTDILVRFSLFRMALPVARNTIYDEGRWGRSTALSIDQLALEGFPNLHYLPDFFEVDDGPAGASFFLSEAFHDGKDFAPDGTYSPGGAERVPPEDVERYGDVYSARYLYAGRAVFRQISRWMAWLKSEGVYDNTRIVIVSDHGHPLNGEKFGPQSWWRPLILVKDYRRRGPVQTDETLKTNADVPSMLTAGLPSAIPPRPAEDRLLIHEAPWWVEAQGSDHYVFGKTWTLSAPDARVPENWVEVNP